MEKTARKPADLILEKRSDDFAKVAGLKSRNIMLTTTPEMVVDNFSAKGDPKWSVAVAFKTTPPVMPPYRPHSPKILPHNLSA